MKNRSTLFLILTALTITTVIASNITAGKPMSMPFGLAATTGILSIPISYVVNDTMVEIFGFRKARFAIALTYSMNALAIGFFLLAIAIPGAAGFQNQAAFVTVLSTTPRLFIASLCGFFAGALSNAWIMDRMHLKDGEGHLYARCMVSTVFGETLDKICFVNIAFLGVLPLQTIWTMIATQSTIAIVYEAICYPLVTQHVIKWAKTLPDHAA